MAIIDDINSSKYVDSFIVNGRKLVKYYKGFAGNSKIGENELHYISFWAHTFTMLLKMKVLRAEFSRILREIWNLIKLLFI